MTSQDNEKYLFERSPSNGQPAFKLRPDIVIRDSGGHIVIVDTKWKVLSDKRSHFGISQSDMYQMYAYFKCYGAAKVVLCYPVIKGFRALQSRKILYSGKKSTDPCVMIHLFDVENARKSAKELLKSCGFNSVV